MAATAQGSFAMQPAEQITGEQIEQMLTIEQPMAPVISAEQEAEKTATDAVGKLPALKEEQKFTCICTPSELTPEAEPTIAEEQPAKPVKPVTEPTQPAAEQPASQETMPALSLDDQG